MEHCVCNKSNEEKNILLSPLAETWCKFWGDGVGALAPKVFFYSSPKMRNLGEGTAGDSLLLGTKCWLSISLPCIDAVYITTF